MSERVMDYVLNFIKKEYPLYCDELEDVNYHKMLVSLLEKNYNDNLICFGMADKIIRDNTKQFIEKNLKHVDEMYKVISETVKRLILSKNNYLGNLENENILDAMVDYITIDIIKNRDKKKNRYLDSIDKIDVLKKIDAYSNRFLVKVRDRVRSVLSYNSKFKNIDFNNIDYFINNISDLIIKKHNVVDIIDGSFDATISALFEKFYYSTEIYITSYMNKILSKVELDRETYRKLALDYVMDNVFKVGSFKIEGLFNGDYDSLIIEFVNGKKKDNIILEHIYKKIDKLDNYNLSEKELMDISLALYNDLTNEYRDNMEAILDEKNDEKIHVMFYKKMVLYNSIENENKPKKIKNTVTYRKISDAMYYVLKIACIAALSFLILYSSYNVIDNYISKGSAYSEVSKYGNIGYELVYSPDNENVEIMAQRAVEFYNRSLSKNTEDTNYGYLGFACVYRCMMQDRLYIMDEILREAQTYAGENSDIYLIHEQIKNETCFLEFAMHRLEEMGCEKIKKPKYINALNVYKEVMKDKESKPMVIIEKKYPEECKLIEEIMEMYRKYNEDMIIDFSNEINIKKAVDGTDVIEYYGTRRNR